jgi:hypothetical protein
MKIRTTFRVDYIILIGVASAENFKFLAKDEATARSIAKLRWKALLLEQDGQVSFDSMSSLQKRGRIKEWVPVDWSP